MKEKATQLISWWQSVGSIQQQDSRVQMMGKTMFRILGILLLLVVSPILVTALVVLAFVAVI